MHLTTPRLLVLALAITTALAACQVDLGQVAGDHSLGTEADAGE